MKSPPRYEGKRYSAKFLYDLALFADEHIGRQLGLDLEYLAEDLVKHNELREQECRDLRRTAEELEVEAFKHIK